jgi:23S rRNA pseudouridine1911/1915/1917 synthase
VLYEDNHLIAVFKPSGVLTQGDSSGEASLLEQTREDLRRRYGKPGNVFLGLLHRLDKPVSGVVLFAKTSKAAGRLSEQIRAREVEKTYHALVEGNPAEATRQLVHYLGSDGAQGVAVSLTPGLELKRAVLSYRKIGGDATHALLAVDLETGRKHQIRAQLAAIGHPIAGDAKYGSREKSPLDSGGIALVAERLRFQHPTRPDTAVEIALPNALDPLRGWLP